MDQTTTLAPTGPFEARYLAFLETIPHLRPRLHRYCARMTGSVMDGEDIVQEALFQAYRRLDRYDDTRDLAPWIFRIAHNQCIDFLRRRRVRRNAEVAALGPEAVMPDAVPAGAMLHHSVEHLVLALAPKERACILLKDVLEHTLEEIAEMIGASTGAVKSALNRGRVKLDAMRNKPLVSAAIKAKPSDQHLLRLYVERFNLKDWDGIRELITADAQLLVADRFAGPLRNAPYFARYESMTVPWRMAVGEVDGILSIVSLEPKDGHWMPHSIIEVEIADDRIARVVDFRHCPWVMASTSSVNVLAA